MWHPQRALLRTTGCLGDRWDGVTNSCQLAATLVRCVAGARTWSSTNRRIAEDRLPFLRFLSISATTFDSVASWAFAIFLRSLQNSFSRLTLVLCPAIATERLMTDDFMIVSPIIVVAVNHRNGDSVFARGKQVPCEKKLAPNLVCQYLQWSETTVLKSSGGGIQKLACSSQLPMIGTEIEPSLIFGLRGNPPFVLAKGVRGRRRVFVWAVYEQRSIFRPDIV